MENAGCVIFDEKFLKEGGLTKMDETVFVVTILHELSHMWFGNMITMKW